MAAMQKFPLLVMSLNNDNIFTILHYSLLLVSTTDWDDHMFAHSLEDQAINDATTNSLLGVTFQQQEQYDMPLIYTQNDTVLAQELEKQVQWNQGVLPIMAYTGRLCPKGVPFSGFRYIRG